MQLHNCRRGTGNEGNEGNEGNLVSRFVGAGAFGSIGAGDCPSIHAATWPGHFDLPDSNEYAGGDYTEEDVNPEDVLDAFGYDEGILASIPPEFAAVSTPDEFQAALRAGVNHIVLKAHLDMIDSTPEPDLQRVEALDGAIGRVLNTTLSIMVRCQPPARAAPPHLSPASVTTAARWWCTWFSVKLAQRSTGPCTHACMSRTPCKRGITRPI